MASTENFGERLIKTMFQTLMLFALPLFFLYLYTLTFDWVKSDQPMYSNSFGIGSDFANQLSIFLGAKLDFYLLIIIEHGFAIIFASAICTPFVRVFYRNHGYAVTFLYVVIGAGILFSTRWPDTQIYQYLDSDLSFQLVLCGMIVLPQAVYGVFSWLTSGRQ